MQQESRNMVCFCSQVRARLTELVFDPNSIHNPEIKFNIKAFLGGMFADYLHEYTHWAWGDIDTVMGDLSKLIDDLKLNYDVTSYQSAVWKCIPCIDRVIKFPVSRIRLLFWTADRSSQH
jgi:hypothetical protein